MKTVNEVCRLVGISKRTLQYYDKIGLLTPPGRTEAGYRLYDDANLEKLQQILLFRELEFPLQEIRRIIESPDFDRTKALEQQISLLTLKKEHLENLILFARGIRMTGVKYMDFSVFDTSKIDEYAKQAKESWGNTAEYKEFEEKDKKRTAEQIQAINAELMNIFVEFGDVRNTDPSSDQAQALVCKLQKFISKNFYVCSNEVLLGLGKMYADGGDFTTNIDNAGGNGTAVFVYKAILTHCNYKLAQQNMFKGIVKSRCSFLLLLGR